MKPKAIIVSGYFNPLHKGHIEYLNQSNILPDKIQETKKAITLYELYLLILNNIKKYEATKPISTGGKKSIKNKKKVFNNTKKKI